MFKELDDCVEQLSTSCVQDSCISLDALESERYSRKSLNERGRLSAPGTSSLHPPRGSREIENYSSQELAERAEYLF